MKPRTFECVECHKQFKSESSKKQHCKDKHHPPQELNTNIFPCGRCSLKCSTITELILHSSTHVQTPIQRPYVLDIGRTYPFAQTPEPPSRLIDACTQGGLPPRCVKTEAENYTPNSNSRVNAGSLDVKGKGSAASQAKERHCGDIASTSRMSNAPLIASSTSFGGTHKDRNTEPCANNAPSAQPRSLQSIAAIPRPAGTDQEVGNKADLARHCQERHGYKCKDCQTYFKTERDLEIHIRDTPDHICCSMCNVTYRLEVTLQYHITVNHSGQRPPAECLICGKRYKSVGVLEDHIAVIHSLDTHSGLHIVDGTAQYGSLPDSPANIPATSGLPEREDTGNAEVANFFTSAHAANVLGIAAASPTQSATIPGAEDDGLPMSGSTSEENVSPTARFPVAHGGRERGSSLVASDSGSWSEVSDVSDVDSLSDLLSGNSNRGDQSGPTAMSDSQQASGTEIRNEVIWEQHLSVSSAVISDGPDILSVLGDDELKDDEESEPKVHVYSTAHTSPEAVPQEQQTSVRLLATAWGCKACNSMPTSPMITMCGHIFCRGCIIAEISTNFCCPTCKYPILVEVKL